MTTPPAQRRRPRHLMDPNNLVRTVNDRSLTNVQRWILSTLTVVTVGHLAVGLVIAAVAISPDLPAQRVGLSVIAGLFGLVGLAAGFLVHGKSPLRPWTLLGLLPGVVGLILVLG